MQFTDRDTEFASGRFDGQPVAADLAEKNCRHPHQFCAFNNFHRIQRPAANDDARLRFAKEQDVQPDFWEGRRVAVPKWNRKIGTPTRRPSQKQT